MTERHRNICLNLKLNTESIDNFPPLNRWVKANVFFFDNHDGVTKLERGKHKICHLMLDLIKNLKTKTK